MESSTEFLSLIELLKEEDEYFENKLAIVLLILKANIKRDSVFTKIPELNVNYILSYLFEPQKGNPTSFI